MGCNWHRQFSHELLSEAGIDSKWQHVIEDNALSIEKRYSLVVPSLEPPPLLAQLVNESALLYLGNHAAQGPPE